MRNLFWLVVVVSLLSGFTVAETTVSVVSVSLTGNEEQMTISELRGESVIINLHDSASLTVSAIYADRLVVNLIGKNTMLNTGVVVVKKGEFNLAQEAVLNIDTLWADKILLTQYAEAALRLHKNINVKETIIASPGEPENQVSYGWDNDEGPVMLHGNGMIEGLYFRIFLGEHLHTALTTMKPASSIDLDRSQRYWQMIKDFNSNTKLAVEEEVGREVFVILRNEEDLRMEFFLFAGQLVSFPEFVQKIKDSLLTHEEIVDGKQLCRDLPFPIIRKMKGSVSTYHRY